MCYAGKYLKVSMLIKEKCSEADSREGEPSNLPLHDKIINFLCHQTIRSHLMIEKHLSYLDS